MRIVRMNAPISPSPISAVTGPIAAMNRSETPTRSSSAISPPAATKAATAKATRPSIASRSRASLSVIGLFTVAPLSRMGRLRAAQCDG